MNFKVSGDSDDYILFQTASNVPEITTVGACDLKITASSGDIDFDDDNITTIGTITGINVTSGSDPGHTHTGSSLSGIDISSDTNLAVTSPITLTGDTVGFDFGTVNTWTEENTFQLGSNKNFIIEKSNGTNILSINVPAFGSPSLNMNSFIIKSIGNVSTTFTSSGGLNLANALTILDGGASIQQNTAITNTSQELLKLKHVTTGTATTNFGGHLVIQLEKDSGLTVDAFKLDTIWTDATHPHEDSDAIFSIKSNRNLIEVMRIDGSAQALLFPDGKNVLFGSSSDSEVGFDGSNLVLDASRFGSGGASGYIVLKTEKTTTGDPTGVEGKIYWNTIDNVIKMYADGAWRTLASW